MLLDPRNVETETTTINVQNKPIEAKASGGQKFAWYFLFILGWLVALIPGIIIMVYAVKKTNDFKRLQNDVNEAASNIDVNLTKRAELLVKLVDSTRGYMKFEENVMQKVTALRSGAFQSLSRSDRSGLIADVSDAIRVQLENYPNLGSIDAVLNLQRQTAVCENEILAARTIYNRLVNQFNREIFVFPSVIFATKLRLYTMPLFMATAQNKQDVKLNLDLSSASGFGQNSVVKK